MRVTAYSPFVLEKKVGDCILPIAPNCLEPREPASRESSALRADCSTRKKGNAYPGQRLLAYLTRLLPARLKPQSVHPRSTSCLSAAARDASVKRYVERPADYRCHARSWHPPRWTQIATATPHRGLPRSRSRHSTAAHARRAGVTLCTPDTDALYWARAFVRAPDDEAVCVSRERGMNGHDLRYDAVPTRVRENIRSDTYIIVLSIVVSMHLHVPQIPRAQILLVRPLVLLRPTPSL